MSYLPRRSESGSAALVDDERPRLHRTGATATLALAALLVSTLVQADEIRIDRGDCTSGVHLVALNARLSDVLMRLSQSLGFQLSFEAKSDPLINFDAAMLPADLVARLAPDGNISATENDDPRCKGQKRIVRLWVLSKSAPLQGSPPTAQQALQVQQATAQAKVAEALQVQSFLAETHGFNPAQKASP